MQINKIYGSLVEELPLGFLGAQNSRLIKLT